VPARKQTVTVSADEVPRRDSSLEALGKLRPAFTSDGTVTAGNSSPLNDGAGALLLTSPDYARAHGLRPLARIRSSASAGVPPRIMGIGPVPAAAKALERAGLRMEDMGVVEVNEAFAAQVLAVLRAWDMDPDDDRVNPNGGAIALGHPLGASGARIVGTTVRELHRRDAQFALVSMCIGVGQGIALVLERIED
jgi:acetyl-CoA acyltransferase